MLSIWTWHKSVRMSFCLSWHSGSNKIEWRFVLTCVTKWKAPILIVRTFDWLYVATTSCALLESLAIERLTDMCPRERRRTIIRKFNSKCVPRHVAGPQVCSPNKREIVSSIYRTYAHAHAHSHAHARVSLPRWLQMQMISAQRELFFFNLKI